MIELIETKNNEGILDQETLKKLFAGLTDASTPCHCNRCGTKTDSDTEHADNTSI